MGNSREVHNAQAELGTGVWPRNADGADSETGLANIIWKDQATETWYLGNGDQGVRLKNFYAKIVRELFGISFPVGSASHAQGVY